MTIASFGNREGFVHVETVAGVYRLDWIHDPDAERPYQDGITVVTQQAGRSGAAWVTVHQPDDATPASRQAVSVITDQLGWPEHSGAAITRYLGLAGMAGATLFDSDYQTVEPDAQRGNQQPFLGVAWIDAEPGHDHTHPDAYAAYTGVIDGHLAELHNWAGGETFGWQLHAPDGSIVDECWGYYGCAWDSSDPERKYTYGLAVEAAQAHTSDLAAAAAANAGQNGSSQTTPAIGGNEQTDLKIETPYDALVLACTLALTAPSEKLSAECVAIADRIAATLTEAEVDAATDEAARAVRTILDATKK